MVTWFVVYVIRLKGLLLKIAMSKRLTQPQKDFFAKIETSISRLWPLQTQCRMLRLFIIERELVAVENGLRNALELQRRAYSDDSLTSPEPLLVTGTDKSR